MGNFLRDKTYCNEKPKKDDTSVYDCCNGTQIVTDKRFNVSYSCPKCTHNLEVM